MTFVRLVAIALLSLSFLAPARAAPLDETLPVAPYVKVGKLANGLTYYIQKNGRPEKKLELRLVVKAGSILEDEDQLGLAHFTEHMAFNGSTNFKRHELVSYLQSIGIKFGADLNAYTGFDETVYILPIPTDKRENIEKGFLVLQDWAQGVQFNDADIESERGIVLEELRLGKGANDRMNKLLLPRMFNGSRYAERLPIGKADVLRTFKPDAIRRFYKDWYRPDLMAVIAVGDIEPADAEKLIQQHFGQLKNPVQPRPRIYAEIPERTKSDVLVLRDREASGNMLLIRYPIVPRTESTTLLGYRSDLIEQLSGMMLSARMAELTQRADPPFIQGGSGMSKVVRGYRSFNVTAMLGKGGATPAINALVQENERARQFGFTASELERAKRTLLRNVERAHNERDKSDSRMYASEYLRNFLEGEAIPGIENEYRYASQLVPGITLDEVNAAVRKAIPAEDAKLVVYMGVDSPDVPAPVPAELLAAVDAARKTTLTAREDKVYGTKLMEEPPKPGKIVSETVNQPLGTTELLLGNGVHVVLKPTDFRNDQVLLGAVRLGGQSLFDDKDIFNARYASAAMALMGTLDYSPLDLQKILAGRSVNAAVSLSGISEALGGTSGSADIETMLQLLYARLMHPRIDPALFESFLAKQRDVARNSLARPEAVFADTVGATLFNNHPRVPRAPRVDDFDKVQLDRVADIYRQRFGSAKGWTLFLVGSFDVEKVKPLIATYIASLPAGDIATTFRDPGVRPVRGVVKKEVRRGREAKSNISITFAGDAAYSQQEQVRLQAMLEVLNIKLTEVLREQMGLIYGGGSQGTLSKLPYGNYAITLSLPCGPENVEKVIAAAFAEIRKLQAQGPEAGDLEKVKQNWTTNHRRSMRENGYWLNYFQGAYLNGIAPETILQYGERVDAVKAADIKDAASRYFDFENYVQVVLYPEAPAP
ncbi:M16 family metallopeptidase [Massilia sp. SM-13]|uniref:M16 family metallopeptidase n=1 Tax=Pseudoduganella rhizocola TaxID=3382643 RepID=UPI0038B61D19